MVRGTLSAHHAHRVRRDHATLECPLTPGRLDRPAGHVLHLGLSHPLVRMALSLLLLRLAPGDLGDPLSRAVLALPEYQVGPVLHPGLFLQYHQRDPGFLDRLELPLAPKDLYHLEAQRLRPCQASPFPLEVPAHIACSTYTTRL
ncbi:uncharacterized protein N7443_000092 [Penicillium atrosanguineum]|uniref:uncharacterized protein n=1 Tax=Penicillium atrosanguineum TaxID=1132637 RepID=UPI0023A77D5B|nr:uncharacterized protein N7443_000092 [Penicillium atrosanguineum]KAJ5313208.1 hypothetical protein N7443_000092 [Penicillium atrosanguineum]